MTDPSEPAQSQGVDQAMKAAAPAVGAPEAEPEQGAAAPLEPLSRRERDALFREIYQAHLDYVWHSLRRFGVFDRELEDAAHEVFVVVHRRLDDYDRRRPIKPWLVGIAFRVASDFRRRASARHESMRDEVEAVDTGRRQDAVVAQKESRALVHRALDVLEPDRRAVFVLHEIDGHTMPVIAEITGAPLNTCYSRLRLARKQFKEAVQRLVQGPEAGAAGGEA